MDIVRTIEVFAAINFLVIGLSHIFQPRAWADFFIRLHDRGRPGAFVSGFLSLATGSVIVTFHNVWSGLPTVLTVLGWAYLVKATIAFVRPEWALASMARARPERAGLFIVPGVVLVVLAALLFYCVWSSGATSTT